MDFPVSRQSFCFDTVCEISVYETAGDMDEKETGKLIDEAFKLCGEYEDLFSRTRKGSDIYRINHAEGERVYCDKRTLEVIKKGIYFGEISEGRFDISIGRLTELWDFHADDPVLPAEEEIREALAHMDYRKIELSEEGKEDGEPSEDKKQAEKPDRGGWVRLSDPQMMLDLGGLAKGYAADRVYDFLKERGVKSAVINLGGNVECLGEKPAEGGGLPFKIGIETPYSDRSEISETLELRDETAVTSGVYERFFEAGGKKYHHILDPSTGYPCETDLLSATIVSESGNSCDADALSTICLMLGKEGAEEFLRNLKGFEGHFIESHPEGK